MIHAAEKESGYDLMLEIEEEYRKVVRTWPTKKPVAPRPRRGMVRITERLG